MQPEDQSYASLRATLQAMLDNAVPGTLPANLVRELASTRIVLSREALALAMPQGAAANVRSETESIFVLFDGTEGNPPRQFTVIVREASESMWELEVTAAPPVEGVFLMTIGVQNFAGRFRTNGSATIPRIPAAVLSNFNEPGLELAVLPIAA